MCVSSRVWDTLPCNVMTGSDNDSGKGSLRVPDGSRNLPPYVGQAVEGETNFAGASSWSKPLKQLAALKLVSNAIAHRVHTNQRVDIESFVR